MRKALIILVFVASLLPKSCFKVTDSMPGHDSRAAIVPYLVRQVASDTTIVTEKQGRKFPEDYKVTLLALGVVEFLAGTAKSGGQMYVLWLSFAVEACCACVNFVVLLVVAFHGNYSAIERAAACLVVIYDLGVLCVEFLIVRRLLIRHGVLNKFKGLFLTISLGIGVVAVNFPVLRSGFNKSAEARRFEHVRYAWFLLLQPISLIGSVLLPSISSRLIRSNLPVNLMVLPLFCVPLPLAAYLTFAGLVSNGIGNFGGKQVVSLSFNVATNVIPATLSILLVIHFTQKYW